MLEFLPDIKKYKREMKGAKNVRYLRMYAVRLRQGNRKRGMRRMQQTRGRMYL
jgi:hypothetical protein